ncbi:MAG: UDP-N-acetylglucosamine 2-epimerase (non-hydrolyzing) [Thalassolituus oleivorans]
MHLGVGSGSHAAQTAAVMLAIEPILLSEKPDAIVVVGDVNSTLASALVAAKLHVPVAHVEAGLRSGDRSMPEEINRIATDAISDYCYVSEPSGATHLAAEGVPAEKIIFAGNVMIDSLVAIRDKAAALNQAAVLGLKSGGFALITLHRPQTVDDPVQMARALDHLDDVLKVMPAVMPLHPRTRARLEEFGLAERIAKMPGLLTTLPLGYLEFASLMQDAWLVVTDSGGIQEETTFLGVPCITMRPSTERPVTVTEGTNVIFPVGSVGLPALVEKARSGQWKKGVIPKGWDGAAATRIAAHLAAVLG